MGKIKYTINISVSIVRHIHMWLICCGQWKIKSRTVIYNSNNVIEFESREVQYGQMSSSYIRKREKNYGIIRVTHCGRTSERKWHVHVQTTSNTGSDMRILMSRTHRNWLVCCSGWVRNNPLFNRLPLWAQVHKLCDNNSAYPVNPFGTLNVCNLFQLWLIPLIASNTNSFSNS